MGKTGKREKDMKSIREQKLRYDGRFFGRCSIYEPKRSIWAHHESEGIAGMEMEQKCVEFSTRSTPSHNR